MYFPRAISAGLAAKAGRLHRAIVRPAKTTITMRRTDRSTMSVVSVRWGNAPGRLLYNSSAGRLVPAPRLRALSVEPGFHDERVLAGVEVVALAAADHAESKALVEGQGLVVGRPDFEKDQL